MNPLKFIKINRFLPFNGNLLLLKYYSLYRYYKSERRLARVSNKSQIEQESSIRNRKAKNNILFLLLFKGGSILISLIYVPLLLNALDSDEYAVWLTLTSIVGWLVVTDIGLGNGLRNKLAESLAHKNSKLGKEYVSTAYVFLTIVLFAIILIILFISQFLDWQSILNAGKSDFPKIGLLVNIVFVSFCLQFNLSLINSVLLAIQMPAISALIGFIGQLLSLFAVFIIIKILHCSSLLVIGTTISVIPIIVYLLATIIFYRRYVDIAPNRKDINLKLIKDILNLGVKFFILQIIGIVLFYSNNLIILHAVGNDAVVEYHISYKYMNCIYMIFTIVSTPIWSATTEAFANGDMQWIQRTNSKLKKMVGVLFCVGIGMIILSPYVFKLWLGKNVFCGIWSLSLLLLYFVFFSLYGCYGFILNGMGKLKLQIIVTSILALCYIPISYSCGKLWGLNGVLFIFLLNQIINFSWSRIQYNRIINNTASGIWNE